MKLHHSVTRQVAIDNFYTLENRFNKTHNNKYSYDKSVFINTKTKITITCPIHGDFEQTVGNHLNGKGCLQCSGKAILTTEDWVNKAKNIHQSLYDYSNVNYINARTKVEIICRTHGPFWMTPNNHLGHYKQGCPTCGIEFQANAQRDTTKSFIEKALKVHKHKYSYSNTNYVQSSENITITCPEHGDFEQTPNSHLSGSGCSACVIYGFNKDAPAILYYLSINNGEAYKVGITNRTIEERFNKDMQYINILKTWHYSNGEDAYDEEQRILKEFKQFKYTGPDLLKSGNTELFNTDVLNITTDITMM